MHQPSGARLSQNYVPNLKFLMARVSLVSCINFFGVNQLNTFSVQLGAHQIINWCAPMNYLNYLVHGKSFGAHLLIS